VTRARTLADDVLLACVLEATARKPGNVHPGASFADLAYADLVRAAAAIAAVLGRPDPRGVGHAAWEATRRTRGARSAGNPNLGIILLIAPLAQVDPGLPLPAGIGGVLAALDRSDADYAYRAIRLANPGGLGRVDEEDVAAPPSVTLLAAMRMAAPRDAIALQYATNFQAVFDHVDRLAAAPRFADRWEEAVIGLHLELMARLPDTLIARKCGAAIARESADRARRVLEAGWPERDEGRALCADLDLWLRADGHRRNPGTTADLVAATLLAAFRDGRVDPPSLPQAAIPLLAEEEPAR
jgi:triphosphoribosyl-dephospho-CoA synthase